MAAPKSTPKDAQVMASILKELGVSDYEPRVLNQMLEFTYRYVTSILDDAQLFSTHAKKKSIDIEDVKLATELQVDKYFTSPPTRDLLLEIARQKNGSLLPIIKSSAGLRLPPDRYSLTSCNYRLRSSKKIRTVSRLNVTGLPPNQVAGSKISPAVSLPSKMGATLAVVTRANTPTVSIVSRPAPNLSSLAKTSLTPASKFSDGNQSSLAVSVAPMVVTAAPMVTASPHIMIPTSGTTNPDTNSIKRKREDDLDDYDVE